MKLKLLFILLLLMSGTFFLRAGENKYLLGPKKIDVRERFQKHTVSGIVVDESGVKLPDVNGVIKRITSGNVTDGEGHCSVQVQDNETILIFSFVGFVPQEIPVGGQTDLKMILKG